MSVMSLARNTVFIESNYDALCERIAVQIVDLVQAKPDAVLGLATGSTPLGVYAALARHHRENNVDFSYVTCFNLDEYYPLEADDPQSYHRFMQTHLFSHINCRRWHIPSGRQRSPEEIDAHCRRFEAKIRVAGGIDLQLLGIGRTGHIGFNEPGSSRNSRTRLVQLAPETRRDASKEFGGIQNVPYEAISMGIGTILEARTIIMMASGSRKADIVRQALHGEVTDCLPASLLRRHPNASFFLDREAGHLLCE